MKLEKAIEIKEIYYKGGYIPLHAEYREADRLSIEAMQRVNKARHYKHDLTQVLLPSETEE